TRVFESFRRETVPLTERDVTRELDDGAEPYYRSVWLACSIDEKLALRQLADEGVVNPRNLAVFGHLMRSGLVLRDPKFHIVNETFRRFIIHATPVDRITAWEHEGVKMPWSTIRTTSATVVLGVLGLLVFTQQQLMDAWIGFVPTLVPALPT